MRCTIIGPEERLPFIARKWIRDLESENDALPPGVDVLFAPEVVPELIAALGNGDRPVVVYPGPAWKLTGDQVTLLTAAKRVACILCDHLPDEGAEALPGEIWTRFREVLFFPPWCGSLQPPAGRAFSAEDPVWIIQRETRPEWTVTMSVGRESSAIHASWDLLRTVLAEAVPLEVLGREEAEARAAQPLDQCSPRVVVAASDNSEDVLRAAIVARRLGATLVDWTSKLSVMRQSLEDLATWSLPGEEMPWDGLRRAMHRIFQGASRSIIEPSPRLEDFKGWICSVADRLSSGAPSSVSRSRTGATNELLRRCVREGRDPTDAGGRFLWHATIEDAVVPAEWLSRTALNRLEKIVVNRQSDLAIHLAGLAPCQDRIFATFERLVFKTPELGWTGVPLFHGLCDGHLIGWRRDGAQRARALLMRVKDRPGWISAHLLAISMALGQGDAEQRDWQQVADTAIRVGCLGAVLRSWMPFVEAGDRSSIGEHAIAQWFAILADTLEPSTTAGATAQMVAAGYLYLGEASVPNARRVMDLAERDLTISQVAGLCILACVRAREGLARDLWDQHCRGRRPATLRDLAPVAFARALVTREPETATWLRDIEHGDPEFFLPAVPSNARCFNMALAWRALGNLDAASSWRSRAEGQDPTVPLRSAAWDRAAPGPRKL